MRDHPCQPLTGYESMDDAERLERVAAFRQLMAKRRTVREFSDRAVERTVVEQAILTAGSAPSGADRGAEQEAAGCYRRVDLTGAPVSGSRGGRPRPIPG